MKKSRRTWGVVLSIMMFALLIFQPLCIGQSVAWAAETEFHNGGNITLTPSGASEHVYIYLGSTGRFKLSDGSKAVYESEDSDILFVGSAGKYRAKDEGIVTLTVTSLDGDEESDIEFKINVVKYPTNLKLSPRKKTETKPTQDADSVLTTKFKISGATANESSKIDITVTDGDMTPYITRSGNVVTLSATHGGNCTVTVDFNGVKTTFKWILNGIAAEPCLLSTGKSSMVSVLHAKASEFRWTSDDKKIATVTSGGRISAKKTGNVVITGVHKNDDYQVGCVVSVTSENKVKAIQRAIEIGKGTYSQARRMQTGYYDCSSLVWRAYAPYGYNFGVPSGYAPVAATEAYYLDKAGKSYGAWNSKYMSKMRYQAGDLMFRTNTGNGRYKGINHVEMITGYTVVKFTASGKATVICTWASRNPEYSYSIYSHDIVSRV